MTLISNITYHNIERFAHESVSKENLRRLIVFLRDRDVNLYIKRDEGKSIKLFVNNVWGSIYIYATTYASIKEFRVKNNIEVSSNGNGRYDLYHKNGTKYSLFM